MKEACTQFPSFLYGPVGSAWLFTNEALKYFLEIDSAISFRYRFRGDYK